jgi:hypothetical protein
MIVHTNADGMVYAISSSVSVYDAEAEYNSVKVCSKS